MGYYDWKEYAPTTSFRMPKDTLERFDKRAKELRLTKTQLLCYLVRCFLSGKIDPPR